MRGGHIQSGGNLADGEVKTDARRAAISATMKPALHRSHPHQGRSDGLNIAPRIIHSGCASSVLASALLSVSAYIPAVASLQGFHKYFSPTSPDLSD
jgi:hypothetical protein